MDRQFVDFKTASNGTQRDWTGTAALQPVAAWQADIVRSRQRSTYTNKKRMQINSQKKERGEKSAEKRKAKTEKRKLIDHSRQAGRYCAPDVARSIDDRHELC